MRIKDPAELRFERDIVWLDESARQLPYVREVVNLVGSSKSRIAKHGAVGRMVAYASLGPEALNSTARAWLYRRSWWLFSDDLFPGSEGPSDAVDPHSIRPRQLSSAVDKEVWEHMGVIFTAGTIGPASESRS